MTPDLKTLNRRKNYAPIYDNYQCNYLKPKVHKKSQYLVCQVTDRQTDRHVFKLNRQYLACDKQTDKKK